jgi:hypothetical protein
MKEIIHIVSSSSSRGHAHKASYQSKDSAVYFYNTSNTCKRSSRFNNQPATLTWSIFKLRPVFTNRETAFERNDVTYFMFLK